MLLFCFKGTTVMTANKLSLFTVDSAYRNYLRQYDYRIPKKTGRPFVGVVFNINDFYYYVGLTSNKPKHAFMNNSVDFIKIDNGNLGAINLNTMLPVPFSLLNELNPQNMPNVTPDEIKYKNLISDQLTWINEPKNKNILKKNAMQLYYLITKNKANSSLKVRCCNFRLLEQECSKYCKTNNIHL